MKRFAVLFMLVNLLAISSAAYSQETANVNSVCSGSWEIGGGRGEIEFRLVQTGNALAGTVLKITGMHRNPMAKELKGERRGNRVLLESSDGHKIDALVRENEMRGDFRGHRSGTIIASCATE